MQTSFIITVILVLLTSCQNGGSKNESIDSKNISIAKVEENFGIDLQALRNEYQLGYSKILEIDSVFKTSKKEKLKVNIQYFCLFDSAIIVPGKYLLDDTTKTFLTHNYAMRIVIISENDTILKRNITKFNFESQIPEYLLKYGVLYPPNFENYDEVEDIFKFASSLSIPVTDVGESVLFGLKRNGEIISIHTSYQNGR